MLECRVCVLQSAGVRTDIVHGILICICSDVYRDARGWRRAGATVIQLVVCTYSGRASMRKGGRPFRCFNVISHRRKQ